jgi:hypothetical protein
MNRLLISLSGALACFLLAIGCSGGNAGPVAPDVTASPATDTVQEESASTHLWGLWDVYIDVENQKIDAVPMRGACFTANVVRFVDGPPVNLILQLGTIDIQPDYMDIPVDVGLQHPFPGLDSFTGFDVLGVFMGNGTGAYLGPEGFPVQCGNDQRLMNPDGFTRWFNPIEFADAGQQMPILGYYPGKLGSPGYSPNAVLNPYKYFTDDLGKDDDAFAFLAANPDSRGVFSPGSVNHRQYDLRFPSSVGVRFQYAVVAHWEPNVNAPDPPVSIDDFPLSANADEALAMDVDDSSTLFYAGSGSYGGNVILDISPIDWSAVASGAMEEYAIKCYSSAWDGAALADMTPVGGGDNYYTFHFDKAVETLMSANPLPVWIEISYPALDYTNDFGVSNEADGALAGYFLVEIPVGTEIPAWIEVLKPNGGEVLQSGGTYQITWDSDGVPGDVDIAYSKDGFNADINTIENDVPNTGSYVWANIPDDPSTTVRLRIASSDLPSVFDVSDDDFEIKSGEGWVLTWGDLGNDRGYAVDIDDDGNMYVTGFYTGNDDFDPDPYDTDYHSGFGSWDSFVSKFDSTGDYVWARTWGATGYADGARDVAVDTDGNVFVAGWWQNDLTPPQIDLDPGSGYDWHYGTVGDNGYLIKLDANGDYQWGASWAAGDWEWFDAYGVDTDESGNVYVTGLFEGTVDFDPGSGVTNLTTAGYHDTFFIKLSSAGALQWAYRWGGSGWDDGNAVTFAESGNVYVTGFFSGFNVDLDPTSGTDPHSSAGTYDRHVFLSSFTTAGGFNWARTWGGASTDEGHGVAVDGSGNVFCSGAFGDSVDFNPSGGDVHNSNGGSDSFVSKFTSSGNFVWARTWGGTGADWAYDVCTDLLGATAVAGYFTGTVDFDPGNPGGPYTFTAHTNNDAYVVKYDADGDFQWADAWGGTAQSPGGGVEDEAWGVESDISGNFYLTGPFQNTVDFEPGSGETFVTAGQYNDTYLLKLLPNGLW